MLDPIFKGLGKIWTYVAEIPIVKDISNRVFKVAQQVFKAPQNGVSPKIKASPPGNQNLSSYLVSPRDLIQRPDFHEKNLETRLNIVKEFKEKCKEGEFEYHLKDQAFYDHCGFIRDFNSCANSEDRLRLISLFSEIEGLASEFIKLPDIKFDTLEKEERFTAVEMIVPTEGCKKGIKELKNAQNLEARLSILQRMIELGDKEAKFLCDFSSFIGLKELDIRERFSILQLFSLDGKSRYELIYKDPLGLCQDFKKCKNLEERATFIKMVVETGGVSWFLSSLSVLGFKDLDFQERIDLLKLLPEKEREESVLEKNNWSIGLQFNDDFKKCSTLEECCAFLEKVAQIGKGATEIARFLLILENSEVVKLPLKERLKLVEFLEKFENKNKKLLHLLEKLTPDFKLLESQEEKIEVLEKLIRLGLPPYKFEEYGFKTLDFSTKMKFLKILLEKNPEWESLESWFDQFGFENDFQNRSFEEKRVLITEIKKLKISFIKPILSHFKALGLQELSLKDRLQILQILIPEEENAYELRDHFTDVGFERDIQKCGSSEERLSLAKEIVLAGYFGAVAISRLIYQLSPEQFELEERLELIKLIFENAPDKGSNEAYNMIKSFPYLGFIEDIKKCDSLEEKLLHIRKIITLWPEAVKGFIQNFEKCGLAEIALDKRLEIIKELILVSDCRDEVHDYLDQLGFANEYKKCTDQSERLSLLIKIVNTDPSLVRGVCRFFKQIGFEAAPLEERLVFAQEISNRGGSGALEEYFLELGFQKDFASCANGEERLALFKKLINLGDFTIYPLCKNFADFFKDLEQKELLAFIQILAESEIGRESLQNHFDQLGLVADIKKLSNEDKVSFAYKIMGLGEFGSIGLAQYFEECGFTQLSQDIRFKLIGRLATQKKATHFLIENFDKLGIIEEINKRKTLSEKLEFLDECLTFGAFVGAGFAEYLQKTDLSLLTPEEQLQFIEKLSSKLETGFQELEMLDEFAYFQNIEECKTSENIGVEIDLSLLIKVIHAINREGLLFRVRNPSGKVGRQFLIEEAILANNDFPRFRSSSPILDLLNNPNESSIAKFLGFLRGSALKPFVEVFKQQIEGILKSKSDKLSPEDLEHLRMQLWQCAGYMGGIFEDLDPLKRSALLKNPDWIKALLEYPNPFLRNSLIRELTYLPVSNLETLPSNTPSTKVRSHLLLERIESLGILTPAEKGSVYAAVSRQDFFKDTTRQIALYNFLLAIIQNTPYTPQEKALVEKSLVSLFPQSLDRKGLKEGISEIEAINQIQKIVGREAFLKALQDKSEHNISYKASFESYIKELFIGTEGISDLKERLEATFGKFRNPDALFTYLSSIKELPKGEQEEVLASLSQYVVSVLEGRFEEFRYSTENHPHLEKLFADPSLKEAWKKSEEKRAIDKTSGISTQKSVKEELKNKILEDGHLNPINEYEIIARYLKGQNFNYKQEVEKRLASETDPSTRFKLQVQQALIELCEEEITLEDFMRIRPNIDLGELENDLKALQKKAVTAKILTIEETDDPCDLLLIGTEVSGSCQRVNGTPSLNKCLVGYLNNGEIKAIAVKDEKGKIVARSILRLYSSEKGPVLFQERVYNDLKDQHISKSITALAIEKAKRMGVPLVSSEVELPPGAEKKMYPVQIKYLGGRTPFVYSDATRGVEKGPFAVLNCYFLYDPKKETYEEAKEWLC